MANNRMWLVHRPSGVAIRLGKHMGIGWYAPPEASELQRFYDYILQNEGSTEDLILAMEGCHNDLCYDNWQYTGETVEGFSILELNIET